VDVKFVCGFDPCGPNPTLKSYESYLSAAVTDHRPMIANVLLVWYMFLGGHVEEETFWAVDKSYAVVSFVLSFSLLNIVYASDSLETILSHLSIRVMNVIADGSYLHHLNYLLEFLAAWEKRPAYLTPMAYQWCSAISASLRRRGRKSFSLLNRLKVRMEDVKDGKNGYGYWSE
jgi:hypothetical protein